MTSTKTMMKNILNVKNGWTAGKRSVTIRISKRSLTKNKEKEREK